MNENEAVILFLLNLKKSESCYQSATNLVGLPEMLWGAIPPNHFGIDTPTLMARAKLIASEPNPCQCIPDRRVMRVASFEDAAGFTELPVPAGEIGDKFIQKYVELGLTDDKQTMARMRRVRESDMVKSGAISLREAYSADIQGELDGDPLCPDCDLHHPMEDGDAAQHMAAMREHPPTASRH